MWNHVKWPKGVSWAPKNGIWLKKCGSNVADHVHKNFSQRKWKLTTQAANFNNQRGSKPSPDRSDERFELVAGRSGSWDPYIWYIKVSFKLPIQPGINLVQQVVFSFFSGGHSKFNQQFAELIPLGLSSSPLPRHQVVHEKRNAHEGPAGSARRCPGLTWAIGSDSFENKTASAYQVAWGMGSSCS